MADTHTATPGELAAWEARVKAHPGQAATIAQMDSLADVMIDFLKRHQDRMDRQDAEIASLAQRLDQMQKSAGAKGLPDGGRGVRWGGVYEPGKEFRAGQLCTCAGSLWLAKTAATTRPGTDPASWVLVVKAGSYGKREPNE